MRLIVQVSDQRELVHKRTSSWCSELATIQYSVQDLVEPARGWTKKMPSLELAMVTARPPMRIYEGGCDVPFCWVSSVRVPFAPVSGGESALSSPSGKPKLSERVRGTRTPVSAILAPRSTLSRLLWL